MSECAHTNKRYTGTLYIDPMERTWECEDCGERGREVDEASRADYSRRMRALTKPIEHVQLTHVAITERGIELGGYRVDRPKSSDEGADE